MKQRNRPIRSLLLRSPQYKGERSVEAAEGDIPQSQSTSTSPCSLIPSSAITQGKLSRRKVGIPLGTKDPLVGTPFSFAQPVDACASVKSAMFDRGGRPDTVDGEEDTDGGVREEEELLYKLYSTP